MQYFLDRNLTIRKLRKSGLHMTAYSATGTAYPCNLQDLAPEQAQFFGGIGKVYDIFVSEANTDIDTGDEVVIGSEKYQIRGKEVIDFGGFQHINLIGVKTDA